jgi:hypothetical protein
MNKVLPALIIHIAGTNTSAQIAPSSDNLCEKAMQLLRMCGKQRRSKRSYHVRCVHYIQTMN